ncbi:MAG: hypothetical protein G01um101466_525 [Parcubacteria group bacterium Gr01-1014_66]|nr:MAG: hypothetical protein G01um101466_525 [Parcubacteria group bacterium Gr01-1014_66]
MVLIHVTRVRIPVAASNIAQCKNQEIMSLFDSIVELFDRKRTPQMIIATGGGGGGGGGPSGGAGGPGGSVHLPSQKFNIVRILALLGIGFLVGYGLYPILNKEMATVEHSSSIQNLPPLPELPKNNIQSPPPSEFPSSDTLILQNDWKPYSGQLVTSSHERGGASFPYPREWGTITFEKKVKVDTFQYKSTVQNIEAVWYHSPTETIVAIERGKFYPADSFVSISGDKKVDNHYEEIATVYSPTKGVKKIFDDKPWEDASKFGSVVGDLSFSPDGRYVALLLHGWEWVNQFIIDTEQNRNIIAPYDSLIQFYDPNKDILWSSDGNVLAIISFHNDFAGGGTDGLFISEFGDPSKLRKIFSWGEEEHFGNSKFQEISFISNERVQFTVLLKKCRWNGDEMICGQEVVKRFEYLAKPGALRQL